MFALITKEITQSSVPTTVEPALDNFVLWERAKDFNLLQDWIPFLSMLTLREICPLKGWDLKTPK